MLECVERIMTGSNWWKTIDVQFSETVIPIVSFIIRCKECSAEFKIGTLQAVPTECPDCGKRSELDRKVDNE